MDLKLAAKLMFDADCPQKRIAEILRVSERTVSTWVVKGDWKQERQRRDEVFNFLSDGFLDAAHFQMQVTARLTALRRRELDNSSLTIKELENLLMPGGEVDRLTKIANNIRKQDVPFANAIEIMNRFTEYVETHDPALADKLMPLGNTFIEKQRKEA